MLCEAKRTHGSEPFSNLLKQNGEFIVLPIGNYLQVKLDPGTQKTLIRVVFLINPVTGQ